MAVKLWYPKDPAGGCHIALTSGHTLVVSGKPEGTDVPKQFRREAIARGCLPVGMSDDDLDPTQGFDRKVTIRTAIEQMFSGDEDGAFTKEGVPNLKMLNSKVGFTVDRPEMMAIWKEFSDSQDANKDD